MDNPAARRSHQVPPFTSFNFLSFLILFTSLLLPLLDLSFYLPHCYSSYLHNFFSITTRVLGLPNHSLLSFSSHPSFIPFSSSFLLPPCCPLLIPLFTAFAHRTVTMEASAYFQYLLLPLWFYHSQVITFLFSSFLMDLFFTNLCVVLYLITPSFSCQVKNPDFRCLDFFIYFSIRIRDFARMLVFMIVNERIFFWEISTSPARK